MNKRAQSPAMVPLAPAVGAPLLSGAVLCAVSLVASARPLAIKMPKMPQLPKLPDLDLPNFGKKKPATPSGAAAVPGSVKVRAATGVKPATGAGDAPTLADITGQRTPGSISAGEGWKKFPERRMPGANMDAWKEIAKGMKPTF